MTQRQLIPEQAKQNVDNMTRQAKGWIEPLGRFGYGAKGVVYAVIGALALQAALSRGGETTDSQGALQRIVQAPFGQVLLGIVAVGLVGYAIWRLVQAFEDTDNKGTDAKGYITRAAYAGVGLAYLGLALSAVQIIVGSNSQDSGQQGWTARLMAQPFGQLLVGLVGAVIIGVGGYQLYKAYSTKFREELKMQEMSQTEQQWAIRSGRLGFAARGIVFVITGILVITAALQTDASEARGFAGALDTLAQQQYGSWLLGLIALGLIAYGLFCFVEARYRRMVIS